MGMAAVRRRSGAGIVVALVFFVVLAFVGIGGCIWLYQRLELKESALAETNSAIEAQIGEKFTQYQWPWSPVNEPTGLKYTTEVLAPVSDKLEQAREMEAEYQPVVGYESTPRVQQALANAAGDQDFSTLQELVTYHNRQYNALTSQVRSEQQEVRDLEQARAKDEAEFTEQLKQEQQRYEQTLNELRQDVKRYEETKNQLQADLDETRKLKEQIQSELNERERQFRARLVELNQQVEALNDRIEELKRPPMQEDIPELYALAEITAYDTDTGDRFFSAGQDENVMAQDRFVVYELTEEGSPQRKALIRASKVHDIISEFYVVDKQEDAELDVGDKVVTMEMWENYQQATGGE
jgi:hypothetical protein